MRGVRRRRRRTGARARAEALNLNERRGDQDVERNESRETP